jgi:hypothetical protein
MLGTPVAVINSSLSLLTTLHTNEGEQVCRLSIFLYLYKTSHMVPQSQKPILEACYSSVHSLLSHVLIYLYVLHIFTSVF